MNLLRKGLLSVMILALVAGGAMAANVTFQVNMSFQIDLGNFDPATQTTYVKGDFNSWDESMALTDGDEDGIYTGTFEIADGTYEYKYFYSPDGWEQLDNNRSMEVAGSDVTLDVVWFSNQEPQETTQLEILFSVDMSVAIIQGKFDPATDWIVVRGNYDEIGQWGGAVQLSLDTDNIYAAWIEFDNAIIGANLEYKYVILHDGNVDDPNGWETIIGNRIYVPTGNEEDTDNNGYGEYIPETVYYGDTSPDDILTQDLTVVYQVNCTPAYYKIAAEGAIYDVQDNTEVTSFDFVAISGAPPLSWDWGSIPAEHMAFDDGQNGDMTAGDSVFSRAIDYPAASDNTQIYKYGTQGYDTEAGYQMDHSIQFEDNGDTFYIYDIYGSQDTLYQNYPAEVREMGSTTIPTSFSVEQNYPNPFNPTTQIAFSLNDRADVMVKVFNVTGQEVFSHNAGTLNAGRYSVTFDGSNLSSGVYFYQVQAGGKVAVRKMTLMK